MLKKGLWSGKTKMESDFRKDTFSISYLGYDVAPASASSVLRKGVAVSGAESSDYHPASKMSNASSREHWSATGNFPSSGEEMASRHCFCSGGRCLQEGQVDCGVRAEAALTDDM
ncbi:hypothetical protein GOODEAATRI_019706 [Goodea atripinnis]|uniref:Uncharacterized protein n=1 Tax=Goodea atripinnis TaxID=208336 RepID=A0ABV0PFH4_9TELE